MLGNKGKVTKTIVIGLIVAVVIIATLIYILVGKVNKPAGWSEYVSVITTDEGIKIPLPQGFKKLKITNKIDEGIVIEDKEGNQFVWVPVEISNFERETFGIDVRANGNRVILTNEKDKGIEWEPVEDTKTTRTSGGTWEPEREEEYQELLKSVSKYGGFYIARYEATYVSGNTIETYKPGSVKSTQRTEEEMKYEKGTLWNWVSADEAYTIANNMYKGDPAVHSHLVYGVEWDVTLRWFINSGSRTLAEINEDSSSWGNTNADTFSNTDGLINTGEFEETKVNNIYDMAGNLFEWTREYFGVQGTGVTRGGYMKAKIEDDYSAATRAGVKIGGNSQKFNDIGFRVALYIK